MDWKTINALRMARQHLSVSADEAAYEALYRDLQPGLNVYWNGFGQPPTLSFRASFDDLQFNRDRQLERKLVKGRFGGGNLGWILREDMELFACLYQKPIKLYSPVQERILRLIETLGPLNIQQIKEETGFLVKEITPALHKLQEAFILYEDQYDGEWDRSWYRFEEWFEDVDLNRYTRLEALKILLPRFAYRFVWFDTGMAKCFYKIPEKEIKLACAALADEGMLMPWENGYLLKQDAEALQSPVPGDLHFVYAIHRNDPLYKAMEPALKKRAAQWCGQLPYDHEPLQYLLIDGVFQGAVVGHFRNGPYDLNDVVAAPEVGDERQGEILAAVQAVNFGKLPKRYRGAALN